MGRQGFLQCLISLYVAEMLVFCSSDVAGGVYTERVNMWLQWGMLIKIEQKDMFTNKRSVRKKLALSHIHEESWHCPNLLWVSFFFFLICKK